MPTSLFHSSLFLSGLMFFALQNLAQSAPNDAAVTGTSNPQEVHPDSGTDPILFFKKSDLPGLKEKIQSPLYAANWKKILDEAQGYCDPKSPTYADPAIYTKLESDDKFSLNDGIVRHLAGMHYARELSTWMDAIGFAYQMTGNAAYGQHGAALLEAAAHNLPVNSKTITDKSMPPYGDMMRAFAVGLDFFSDAMTPEQRTVITRTARGYILQHIEDYNFPGGSWTTDRIPHNFTGVTGGGLGMLAIALRHDYPAEVPAWIQLADKMSTDWLKAGFDRQGSYFEGVLYMGYGLGNVVIFADARHRYSGDQTLIDNLAGKGISFYLAMERLPGDPAFDARNDSLYSIDLSGGAGSGSPFLLPMASGFEGTIAEDPLAAWLWDNTEPKKHNDFLQIVWGNQAATKEPSQLIPSPYGAYFADQGLCIWRTGWKKEDVMFSIEAGPFHPVTHNQADKGHFNLYGLGYRWAADTGYGNNQEPNGRCETVAHSCVLIDGKGQALSGAGLGTDGKVLQYENTSRAGYALLDCKSAYNTNSKGKVGVPLTKALRHVFFIRPSKTEPAIPAYAVVLDDIEWDGKPHQFGWQMITWQDMHIETTGDHTFILKPPGTGGDTPKMKIIINASAPLRLSDEVYTPDNHPGRPPNVYQRLHALATTSNPHFIAVLAPLPAGVPEPSLAVETTAEGRLIKINWGTRTDTISWNGDEAKLRD
jgi:hypothetical protein